MKAVFETKKPVPKYTTTWDVSVVFKYLEKLYPNNQIPLKNLPYELGGHGII